MLLPSPAPRSSAGKMWISFASSVPSACLTDVIPTKDVDVTWLRSDGTRPYVLRGCSIFTCTAPEGDNTSSESLVTACSFPLRPGSGGAALTCAQAALELSCAVRTRTNKRRNRRSFIRIPLFVFYTSNDVAQKVRMIPKTKYFRCWFRLDAHLNHRTEGVLASQNERWYCPPAAIHTRSRFPLLN